MLESFAHGCAIIFSPVTLLIIFVGVLIGTAVGILPGLGGAATIALLLPLIWRSPPEVALPLLVSLGAVVYVGGAITSILLNIPGEATTAATILDGYPMTQKGEGSRAIGAAITSSVLGGILSVAMSLVTIPMIAPIVMNFKSPEMLFLVIMGISFIAVLTGDSVIKGVISGGLGITVSLIGMHTLTGIPRFTFGSVYLYNGLSIPTVVMGLFGLSEMMDLVLRGQATISKVEITKAKFGDVWVGVKDVFHHWGLWLRCCIVGYIIGVIPGVGPGTAQWLAYGQAKQTSKMRAEFGSGCVEGVIAPQAGNSASPAGDLLTTMAFGIPGSTGMAVLMGGFFLVGLTPGPVMMTKNLDLVFTLLLGVVIANIMAGLLCVACSHPLARVAFIHMDFLYPVIVAIIFIAAYVGAETMLDLVTVIVMGFIGLFMNRFGYSRPAFALGFVMGELFEYYFFRSVLTAGRLFFLRPVCLIMVAILVGLFGYRPLKPVFLRLFRR